MDIMQENYLREMTHCFRALKKPLKNGPKIESFNDLIRELYKAFETTYVNIELVNHIMLAYESNPKEWIKFARYERGRYTRNLVDEGNGKFNLILLCWGPSHGSAIHDHSDSHCFMKMLKGSLDETRFEMPEDAIHRDDGHADIGNTGYSDYLQTVSSRTLRLNEVSYINDNIGLHRVENKNSTEGAVSLHLYCPPFSECSVYESNIRKICPVTFYSIDGNIIKQ